MQYNHRTFWTVFNSVIKKMRRVENVDFLIIIIYKCEKMAHILYLWCKNNRFVFPEILGLSNLELGV